MKKWISVFVLLLASSMFLLASAPANAKPHMLTFEMPTSDCEGGAVTAADLIEAELIYSFTTMPMPSDTDGPCAQVRDPDAPAGSLSVPVPVTDTSVVLNLQPGQQYYARMKVSAFVAGNWSSWSLQAVFTVPYGRPNVIRITGNALGRMEYWLIETSELKFGS